MAARALWRERRLGSLRLLAFATALAVAAITSVGFFADRVRQALNTQSHLLLGADLRLVSQRPWDDRFRNEIRAAGAQLAETVNFPSMVGSVDAFQLADIKAVSDGYPLRGKLRVADRLSTEDRVAEGVPAPGTTWVDARLASVLGIDVGSVLSLGKRELRVAAILTLEPDRGINFFSLAPRAMINVRDLDATGLIQVGSRVRYRLLVAGESGVVADVERRLEARLGSGQRLESVATARPEIRNALDRAERFLSLAAVLAVVLSAAAIGLAIRRYLHAAYDGLAVLRCLGARSAEISALLLRQFLLLAFGASAIGVGAGFAANFVLASFFAQLLAIPLPPPGWEPAALGIAVGVALVSSLALPRLLHLRHLPSLRVIRRDLGPPPQSAWLAYGVAGGFIAVLMFAIARDLRLAAWVFGGFLLAGAFFFGLTMGVVRLLVLARRHGILRGPFAALVATVGRRPVAVAAQSAGLGVGVMALLLLLITQNELVDLWERAAPPEAPDRFVINIQPDQVLPVSETLRRAGISARLEPMVRARLVGIGEKEVRPEDYEDERAQRLAEREFNLSWRADLPEGNEVSAGRWLADGAAAEASVESGIAETLGIQVGDELHFDLAGTPIKARVVGLRRLKWESMRVNFFVIFSPGVLDGFPASHIVSFKAGAEHPGLTYELLRNFPNLTVIDVSAMLAQLRGITTQVIAAVQFLFAFSVLAGLAVVYGTFAVAFDERKHEVAVMRALGATRARLTRSIDLEFATIGALAGVLAALGALLVGGVIVRQVFEIAPRPEWILVLVSTCTCAIVIAVLGRLALRALLSAPPVQTLRWVE